MKSKLGFTLLEVLITSLMIGLLTAAVTMVYLTSYRAVSGGQDSAGVTIPLSQGFVRMVDDLHNARGITICNSTTIRFEDNTGSIGTNYTYTLYTSGGVTKLLKALATDPAGSGQLIMSNIVSASSTLCSASSGIFTIDLTATQNSISKHFKTSVKLNVSPSLPIAWWKFDENTGTTAYDSSGNGYTGTLNGGSPGWVASSTNMGYALTLSAVNTDYMEFTPAITPAANSSYSISLWAYYSLAGGVSMPIFTSTAQTGLYLDSTNKRLKLVGTDASIYARNSTYTPFAASAYFHVVMVVTDYAATSTVWFYVNGLLTYSTNITDNTGLISYSRIGYDGVNKMNGRMDDVRYYNRALSPEEIRQMYGQYGKVCDSNYNLCTATCKDLYSAASTSSCGGCTTACIGGQSCTKGKCCTTGWTNCSGTCTNGACP